MRNVRSSASYLAAILLIALSLHGCGSGSGDGPPPALGVQRVFPNLTFVQPVAMLQAPGDATRWFVVEQGGTVQVFANDPQVLAFELYVDISGQVATGSEMGLLGMTFHPDFPANPRVYLSYTNTSAGRVSRVSEFRLGVNGKPDLTTERILLVINQPETNHKGGNIAFGQDGFLYIGMGDGGGANDQVGISHGPIGNGQNMRTLLGKMLRIDVSPTVGYEIPPLGNAFPRTNAQCGVNGTGAQDCPEIYASGLRNPWRWSFDRQSGELWLGDVGQGMREEIDRVVLGGNYGWVCFEGTADPGNFACGTEPNLLPPVAEYGRTVGTTVTGGYVYRGTVIPGLIGRYVFGDFGNGRIWHIASDTQPTITVSSGFDSTLSISSFGEGNDGELYVVNYFAGQLYKLIGF